MSVLTMASPGASLNRRNMPGHWLLVRLGKRVLRPGGIELTCRMLAVLAIAGPPQRPLSRISLEVRGGVIYATGVEVKTI